MSESNAGTYTLTVAGTPDGGDRIPDLSPREASEQWLSKLKVSKAESTVSSYHYRLKHFIDFCEEQGIDTLRELTGWDIETYETQRRNRELAPVTLSHEMGTIQGFLEYCAQVELVDESLPSKVDPPDVPRDAAVDDTKLHPDDAIELIDHYRASPTKRASRDHALLELAWFTGARLGALRSLDLEDYSSGSKCVRFEHQPREDTPLKNGQDGERVVGLNRDTCDILDEYIRTNRHRVHDDYGRVPLLASEDGRPVTNTIRAWMYLATVPCHYSQCPHGEDPESCDYLVQATASQCPSSRSPHQVRTGSITWQRNRGVPADVVSKRVNSSVRVIETHYDKPNHMEEMEKRRRQHLDCLGLDGGGDE